MNYIEYEMDYERTNKVEVFMTEMAEAIAEFKKFSEVEKSKEVTDYFARVKKVFDKFADKLKKGRALYDDSMLNLIDFFSQLSKKDQDILYGFWADDLKRWSVVQESMDGDEDADCSYQFILNELNNELVAHLFAKNDDIKIYEVLGFIFDEFLESLEHNNIKTKEVSFGIESISGIKKVYESVTFEESLDHTLEKFMNSLDSFQKHYLLCHILNPELHKVYLCSKKFKFWGDEFCEKFGCIKKVYKKLVDLSLESDIYQKYA